MAGVTCRSDPDVQPDATKPKSPATTTLGGIPPNVVPSSQCRAQSVLSAEVQDSKAPVFVSAPSRTVLVPEAAPVATYAPRRSRSDTGVHASSNEDPTNVALGDGLGADSTGAAAGDGGMDGFADGDVGAETHPARTSASDPTKRRIEDSHRVRVRTRHETLDERGCCVFRQREAALRR